jgi:hypothetical protein
MKAGFELEGRGNPKKLSVKSNEFHAIKAL